MRDENLCSKIFPATLFLFNRAAFTERLFPFLRAGRGDYGQKMVFPA